MIWILSPLVACLWSRVDTSRRDSSNVHLALGVQRQPLSSHQVSSLEEREFYPQSRGVSLGVDMQRYGDIRVESCV